jgi:transcriptional regulator with XRE-family HTH domain
MHNISENLKWIRHSKGMSLDMVAEQTGVSKSMLHQIEKGDANPSISVVGKIASGLRISFRELIATPPAASCLVKVTDLAPIKEAAGNYRVWTCFPYEDNHMVEIYRIDIEPAGVYVSGGHGEKTREYIAVLSGEVAIENNGITQIVTKDDVFRFESHDIHVYQNLTEEPVSFLCFFVDYA